MFKILISDKLADEGVRILKQVKEFHVDIKTELAPDELKKVISQYEALIVRSASKVTKEVIAAAKKMKVIGRAGVGLDNVDLNAATQKGIIVMNTPSGNTISTAEHTLSMILALSRNIPEADRSLKAGEWKRAKLMGVELYGKTLGIVGFGRIGSEVAKRCLSFGMKILACDPYLSRDIAQGAGVEMVELKELYKRCDYISLHTPLTGETRHMISKATLALMKKGVRIINCARGGIINEADLAAAVKQGQVAGAAIDVFEKEPLPADSPLLGVEGIVITPHLGASTEEAQVNVALEVAQIVRDALLGRGIRNAANYPCVEPEVCKAIEPYINLAEKLGAFSIQLSEGRLSELSIKYSGELAKNDTAVLSMALVKGVLSPILQETVNYINALTLAKERGIKINESKSSKEEEFVNLIQLAIKTDKETKSVCATLSSNKQPRIVKIDEYYVELYPAGNMIFIRNWDKPGLIGALGTTLGGEKINIAAMTFGRDKPGGRAISVLNIDTPLKEKTLEKLKKIKNVLTVKPIKL